MICNGAESLKLLRQYEIEREREKQNPVKPMRKKKREKGDEKRGGEKCISRVNKERVSKDIEERENVMRICCKLF